MKRRLLSWVIGGNLLVSLSLATLHAQPQTIADFERSSTWRFTDLAPQLGLDSSHVFDGAFNPDGSVWLATNRGLVHYDGYASVRTYGLKDGLPSDFIRCVLKTQSGDLWVGTDRGAGVFDHTTGDFDRRGSESGLAGPSIRYMIEDRSGGIWFCSDFWPRNPPTAGLTHLKDGAWTVYRTDDGLPSDHIYNFLESSKGERFVVTQKGTARFEAGRWILLGSEKVFDIWRINEGADGSILARGYRDDTPEDSALGQRAHSSHLFELKDDQWVSAAEIPLDRLDGGIKNLASLSDGSLLTLSITDHQAKFFEYRDGVLHPASDWLRSRMDHFRLEEAPDGAIWSFGGGFVLRWARENGPWFEYKGLPYLVNRGPNDSLWFSGLNNASTVVLENGVFEVRPEFSGWAERHKGAFWFQDGDENLQHSSSPGAVFDHKSTGLQKIADYVTDLAGNSWFFGLTPEGAPAAVRKESDTWVLLPLAEPGLYDYSFNGSLMNENIAAVDARGAVWYVTADASTNMLLIVKLGRNGVLDSFEISHPTAHFGPPKLTVSPQGNIWLYNPAGFYILNPETRQWSHQDVPKGSDRLYAFEMGNSLAFIVKRGPKNEIFAFDGTSWRSWEAMADLASANPERKGNHYYFQHKTGAFVFDPDEGGLGLITLPDSDNYIVKRMALQDDGSLWFGTASLLDPGQNSVFRFVPNRMPPDTQISFRTRPVRQDGFFIPRPTAVSRFFHLTESSQFLFSWRIDGGPWTPFNLFPAEGLAVSELKTGAHSFEVRAQDDSGNIDTTPARIAFEVAPIPLQERAWYKPAIGCILLLLGILSLRTVVSNRRLKTEIKGHAHTQKKLKETNEHLEETVRKRTREFEKAAKAATKASKAKSEFLANMSHEIRTPMNGVFGMLELTLGTELTRTQNEYLRTAHNSAEALLCIINDILDFSKMESGKLILEAIPFSLRKCVGETVKSLAVQADNKGLELVCQVQPEMPDGFLGDPGRLRQVLTNLIGNALKFTHSGSIHVSVSMGSVDQNGCEALFSVKDTGVGIPKQKLKSIFEAFSQADDSTTRIYGGTGLGLSISTRLVSLMNGRIQVESEEGQGSNFTFSARLPLASEAVPDIRLEDASRLQGLNALIVDDNPINLVVLSELFNHWNMRVKSATKGEDALALIDESLESGSQFDLIMLDAMMPGMDGFTLARRIKLKNLGSTVMMLSSAFRSSDLEQCESIGIRSILVKPVTQLELLESILRVLDFQSNPTEAKPNLEKINRLLAAPLSPEDPALKILLAEDNAINQKVATGMLQSLGHAVDLACNGREAVEKNRHTEYDLIFMDVQMPEMDGEQATREIRKLEAAEGLGRHVPIVAMTAHVMLEARECCIAAGMDDYISKPFKRATLQDLLNKLPAGDATNGSRETATSEETAPASTGAAIDWHLFAELSGHDDELMREAIGALIDTYPTKLTDLRTAIDCENFAEAGGVAHFLKSGFVQIGATDAAKITAEMELDCKNNQGKKSVGILPLVEIEAERVLKELADKRDDEDMEPMLCGRN